MRRNSAKIDQTDQLLCKIPELTTCHQKFACLCVGKNWTETAGKGLRIGGGGVKMVLQKNIIFILVKSFAEGDAGFEGKNGIEQNCQIRRPAWMKFLPPSLTL